MTVDLTQPPYQSSSPIIKSTAIVGAMVVVADLKSSRRFYEDMLGLQCVMLSNERMLVRSNPDLNAGIVSRQMVLDVRQDEVCNPQRMLHHWGIDLVSRESVDLMHSRLLANRESYGLGEIQEPSFNHGAYSFYFQDLDSNWWEFQFRPRRRVTSFERGDVV